MLRLLIGICALISYRVDYRFNKFITDNRYAEPITFKIEPNRAIFTPILIFDYVSLFTFNYNEFRILKWWIRINAILFYANSLNYFIHIYYFVCFNLFELFQSIKVKLTNVFIWTQKYIFFKVFLKKIYHIWIRSLEYI